MKRKLLTTIAILGILCSAAYAVTLGPVRYENYITSFSAAAQDAAEKVTPPPDLELDAAEKRLFQLGVAYGFDYSESGGKSKATSTPNVKTAAVGQVKATPAPQTYVLNKNTKKFHLPSCNSVKQMKESNKIVFTGDRQDVINKGYTPCKNCNP